MTLPAIDPSTLTLVVIIALLAVALIAVSTSIAFNARAQRLPAATKYEDIHERVGLLQRTYAEKQAELREVEQKISERDRYAAEAAYLKEQVEELRRALEQLAPARQEIEQVMEEAAQAAAQKKEVQQELDLAKAELERVSATSTQNDCSGCVQMPRPRVPSVIDFRQVSSQCERTAMPPCAP